jgi:hypothetical protein
MPSTLRNRVARLERLSRAAALGPTCPACATGPGLAFVIERADGTHDAPIRARCKACGRERPAATIRIVRERKPMR